MATKNLLQTILPPPSRRKIEFLIVLPLKGASQAPLYGVFTPEKIYIFSIEEMAVKHFKEFSLEASDEQKEEVSFMDFTSLKDCFDFLEIDLDRPYENQIFFCATGNGLCLIVDGPSYASELATIPGMEIFSCRLPGEVLQFLENPTFSGANLPKTFAPLCYVHKSDDVWEVRNIFRRKEPRNFQTKAGFSKRGFLSLLGASNYLRAHTKSLPGPLFAYEPEMVISVGKSMLVTSLYLSESNIEERINVFSEPLPQLYKNEMWAFCDGAHQPIAEGRESLGAMVSIYTNGGSMDFFDSPRCLQTTQHALLDAKCWSMALALNLAILKKITWLRLFTDSEEAVKILRGKVAPKTAFQKRLVFLKDLYCRHGHLTVTLQRGKLRLYQFFILTCFVGTHLKDSNAARKNRGELPYKDKAYAIAESSLKILEKSYATENTEKEQP